MRAFGVSTISICLTCLVVGNAYFQKKQFYPSVVYITKSNPSMAVIYIQSLVLVLILGKIMKKVFLGTLRAAEFEHLMERFWYALTETCLAFTVFRDDFNPKFVALFTMLLFLKSFHWLAEDRVDYMERSPVIGWIFHLRVCALLVCLGFLDYQLIAYAYQSTIMKGATVQLVFGFEYAILLTMVLNTMIKYVFHAAELRYDSPWENKAVFLLYTELVIGFVRVLLYVIFVVLMVKIYTLPLFAFRPMYYTMRNFKKALNDVILSRRAIRNMNTLYPDATPEELHESDNICIICREDMINNSKKLPCGHIFHTACLRSWFQRQQTCPTCRLNILRSPIETAISNTPPNTNAIANTATFNEGNNQNPIISSVNASSQNNLAPSGGVTESSTVADVLINASSIPLGSPGHIQPFPTMPTNLTALSDDDLRALEGSERRHVEHRIKYLQNIRTLLDASVILMNQYTALTSQFQNPYQSEMAAHLEPASFHSDKNVITNDEISEEKHEEEPTNIDATRLQSEIVSLEDLGCEDELINRIESDQQLSNTSKILFSDSNTLTQQPGDASKGSSKSMHKNTGMEELRKRRLEKFDSQTSKH